MVSPSVGCMHNSSRLIIFDGKTKISSGDCILFVCPYGCEHITIEVVNNSYYRYGYCNN